MDIRRGRKSQVNCYYPVLAVCSVGKGVAVDRPFEEGGMVFFSVLTVRVRSMDVNPLVALLMVCIVFTTGR